MAKKEGEITARVLKVMNAGTPSCWIVTVSAEKDGKPSGSITLTINAETWPAPPPTPQQIVYLQGVHRSEHGLRAVSGRPVPLDEDAGEGS